MAIKGNSLSNLQNNSGYNNNSNNHSSNNTGNNNNRFNSQNNSYGGRDEVSGIPVPVPTNRNNSRNISGINTPGLTPKGISSNYGNNPISVQIALTNSDRTTLSQTKALRRIQQHQNQKANEEQPRRIINYARGSEEEEAEEDLYGGR